MAKELKPEEKIAQRVIKMYQLSPPVDVYKLIKKFALLEEVNLPSDVDADAIFLNENNSYKVILNAKRSQLRKRFTLGHEIGHIKLPWHIGTLSCHAENSSAYAIEDSLYSAIESEANRFSAELLMPTGYVKQIIQENDCLPTIIKKVYDTCQTSLPAVCLKVLSLIQERYVVRLSNGMDNFWYRSEGIALKLDMNTDINLLDNISTGKGNILTYNYYLSWWKIQYSEEEILNNLPEEDAKSILKRILEEVENDLEKRKSYRMSLAGIFGGVNNLASNEIDFYAELQQRLPKHKVKLAPVLEHKDFDSYVRKNVIEISARKKNR